MPNTMKRCRKSKLGMAGGGGWLARDDAESTSWRASCSELKILNFTPKLGKSFVFSKSRCFFFPFGSILEEELVVDQIRGRRSPFRLLH